MFGEHGEPVGVRSVNAWARRAVRVPPESGPRMFSPSRHLRWKWAANYLRGLAADVALDDVRFPDDLGEILEVAQVHRGRVGFHSFNARGREDNDAAARVQGVATGFENRLALPGNEPASKIFGRFSHDFARVAPALAKGSTLNPPARNNELGLQLAPPPTVDLARLPDGAPIRLTQHRSIGPCWLGFRARD